jgi:nucleotide-binding universal stress UspA family protein
MTKLERILSPVDLSTESDEALRYVIALGRAYEAKLILLYCRQPGSIVEWSTGSRAARLLEQLLFRHLDANETRTLDWEPVVAEAEDVGATIAQEAAKRNADLIVMRSRRRPRAAVLLGSTAETVSRTAPWPVLVAHPSEREWAGLTTSEMDLHRLLVAYDASPNADLALNYGVSLALAVSSISQSFQSLISRDRAVRPVSRPANSDSPLLQFRACCEATLRLSA